MSRPELAPMDSHVKTLLDNVHPEGWINPTPDGRYNLVVIGGGTAGLITASVASSMGARTALVERHLMGGDCLNVGCVPSKGVLRGARGAAELALLARLGLLEKGAVPPQVDFAAVMARMREIRAAISSHDSAMRYRDEFGVDVYLGSASFTGPRTAAVSGDDGSLRELSFTRAVIATGARASAPPIPGLADAPYLTNETLFGLTELPKRLVVIGAGPIGCEMAQAFARFGSEVHLFEAAPRIMPREDADAATLVHAALAADGVTVMTGVAIEAVRRAPEAGARGVTVTVAGTSADGEVTADALLVSAGRTPNLEGLGLDAAGVSATKRGVVVDDFLRTSNHAIFAAGDVASPWQFTHIAEATATAVVQNALFLPSRRMSKIVVPWSTYTSPEVATVGLTEAEAERQGVAVDVYRHEMSRVDRARLDGDTDGFVKLLAVRGKLTIVGATIVGARAGEMVTPVVLAIQQKLGLDALAGLVVPYPTESEALKRAAAGYLRARLTARTKAILNRWFRWRR